MEEKKYISWCRVSTKKQGRSGLGLQAQKSMIDLEIARRNDGVLVHSYEEVYTGTKLSSCSELTNAIRHTERIGGILIIAKTDRFRNAEEAIGILNRMGDENILFCDVPSSERMMIQMKFVFAEHEALQDSFRSKKALDAKRKRDGSWAHLYGKNTGTTRKDSLKKAREVASEVRKEDALHNNNNRRFYFFVSETFDFPTFSWDKMVDKLNNQGFKTASGLPFTKNRAIAMYHKCKKIYKI